MEYLYEFVRKRVALTRQVNLSWQENAGDGIDHESVIESIPVKAPVRKFINRVA